MWQTSATSPVLRQGPSVCQGRKEATCDGACNTTSVVICAHGCNATRDECNECTPSSLSCEADIALLCNAEVLCDASGLIASSTCCTSNRCTCDGASCLEDVCNAAPVISGSTVLAGDTCDDFDNIPGDCNPGGTACLPVGSGGSPEEYFLLDLDDGVGGTSTFYDVVLDTSGSSLDTSVRGVVGVWQRDGPDSRIRTCVALRQRPRPLWKPA